MSEIARLMWLRWPLLSGGREFVAGIVVSQVRVLTSLKTGLVERLMRIKSLVAQSSPVEVKFFAWWETNMNDSSVPEFAPVRCSTGVR
ncbi:hypothetical protein TNCV_2397591 [Trichonephila clavipes]|uniref:Uncharacterized protein n=1 Tax=Trichonephila clavipes TaxID=2585209 RepID=A0A8X6VQX5_TRICX|nr:hypothetical protein TNCV_2397591 [Trichonephila clavipes]